MDMGQKIQVLMVSANYPNAYHLWAPWNKYANVAISKVNTVKIDIVVPRPISLPFSFFPYHEMSKIPRMETAEEGMIYHPRFLYLLPKKIFYGVTGNFFRYSISKYISQNFLKPDIIHAHHVYLDGYGVMPICKKWDMPLVVDIHGDSIFTDDSDFRIVNKRILSTLDFADKIICVSENLYSLAKKAGLNEEKLRYIPLGIDMNKFKPRDKETIRKEFNINEEKIVLFVGQITKEKGIDYLLEAISYINENNHIKNTRYVITGYGHDAKEFMDLSQTLGIKNIVTFTGPIFGENLFKWYSLADLFVLPSLFEGRPTVINEAMASECAIIGTDVSGIPEQVKEGYNGFLVEPKNPEMLEEKITYLLNNENEMNKMGKNSRKRIVQKGWTWEGYAKKVTDVYKELVLRSKM